MGFTEEITGRVVNGNGYASQWQSKNPKMSTKVQRVMGWDRPPIPGTLNILCDQDIPWDRLKKRPIPYGAGDPSFVVKGCILSSKTLEFSYPCHYTWLTFVRLFKSTQRENLVEAMAIGHLKTMLDLGTGSTVKVQLELDDGTGEHDIEATDLSDDADEIGAAPRQAEGADEALRDGGEQREGSE